MKTLIIQPSATAEWYSLVSEAEHSAALLLGEELESYLVFLLMRFTHQPQLVTSMIAIEFLQSINQGGNVREQKLQEVGDKCLLLTGLFPELAKKRRLSESYFSDMGQSAYAMLSTHSFNSACLFYQLSEYFEALTLVLKLMRTKGSPDAANWPRQWLQNIADIPLIRH